MAETLNDILTKVSAIVSQSTTVTDTSDEYTLWRSYANMAQKEWAETYEWPSLYAEYNTKTTSIGQVTITLPSGYRKLSAYPKVTADGTTTHEYPEIDPQRKDLYDADDYYCYVLSASGGSSLILNPASIASGISVFVGYWQSPTSLVSPSNAIECPNGEYMVQRIIAYIWEAREDARYLQSKAEASRILSNMVEFEAGHGYAYENRFGNPEERKSYRIGRD